MSSSDDQYSEEDEGEAVQLVQPKDAESGDAGGFILNEDALDEIFCSDEVKDKPIAIYSLTGAYRKGKSFLLNLFLRYLWADKKKEWIGDTTERLSKGFGWRGGIKGDTQGIWIWNEPFLCDTPHGEVNLFLMDTQGAFDLEADVKTSSVIFALSTLIGSVQIYNVMQMIGADDLQNLHLFADYGKSATTLAKKYHMENSKPFQHLIFLIRDWADKDYELGEEGGKKYLATVFSKKTKSKEIKKVQEEIQKYFSKFTCYLLPRPSSTVLDRGSNDKKIQVGEIGDRFLSEVTRLNKHLFEPENIVVKTNNARVMTGIRLRTFILDYFKVFKDGKMPKVDTIVEANMKASMGIVVRESLVVYKEHMKKVCDSYMGPEVFENEKSTCRGKALTHFEKIPKMGESKFISYSKKMLEEQIEGENVLYSQMNETLKEVMKTRVCELMDKTVFTFEQEINKQISGNDVEDSKLEEIKKECYSKALELFQDQTEKFDKSVIGEKNTKLEKLLDAKFTELKKSYHYRLDDLKRKWSQISLKAREKFTSIMEKKCSGKFIEGGIFKDTILEARDSAFGIFDESEMESGGNLKKITRLDLTKQLNAEQKNFEKTNNINLKLDEAQTLKTLNQAKDAYNSYINCVCGEDYVNPDKIKNAHKEGKKQAEIIINLTLDLKGESFVKKCKEQLEEVLADARTELKSKNEKRKEKILEGFRKMKIICFKKYNDEMKLFTDTYQEEDRLLSKHNELKAVTLALYSDQCPKDLEKERISIKNELEFDLNKAFVTTHTNNKHKEEVAKLKANAELESMKTKHMEKLNQVTANGPVDPVKLKSAHDFSKSSLLIELTKAVGMTKQGQDVLHKFETAAEDIFENANEANAKLIKASNRCAIM